MRVGSVGQPHHYLLNEANHYGYTHYEQKRLINKRVEGEVLLQLQKVKGKNYLGELRYINLLWDGGNTLSSITYKKDKEMNLTSKETTRLQIVKIGDSVEEVGSLRFDIDLIDKYGNDVKFAVVILESISTDIMAINLLALKMNLKNSI